MPAPPFSNLPAHLAFFSTTASVHASPTLTNVPVHTPHHAYMLPAHILSNAPVQTNLNSHPMPVHKLTLLSSLPRFYLNTALTTSTPTDPHNPPHLPAHLPFLHHVSTSLLSPLCINPLDISTCPCFSLPAFPSGLHIHHLPSLQCFSIHSDACYLHHTFTGPPVCLHYHHFVCGPIFHLLLHKASPLNNASPYPPPHILITDAPYPLPRYSNPLFHQACTCSPHAYFYLMDLLFPFLHHCSLIAYWMHTFPKTFLDQLTDTC